MHIKRYLKMCNIFILLLLLMMGSGGGGGGRDSIVSRRSRPAGITVPGNNIIKPPRRRTRRSGSTSLSTIIPHEAPFPLPIAELEPQIEPSPVNSSERENSRVKALTEAKI